MKLIERSRLHRLPKRGSHEPETIHVILDAALLAHIGFQINGQPFVIPTLYGREGDKLYLHGSAASRMLDELAAGVAACVTVTLVDGLVLARSAFHHSINYRSVVSFGVARLIEQPEEKTRALRIISEHVIAGRWDDVRRPTEKELKATSVVEFSIEEASAKIAAGRQSTTKKTTPCRSGPAFFRFNCSRQHQLLIPGWRRFKRAGICLALCRPARLARQGRFEMIIDMRTYKTKPRCRSTFLGTKILGPFESVEDPMRFSLCVAFPTSRRASR